MTDFNKIIREVTGGCLINMNKPKQEKRAWVNEHMKNWTEKQKQVFEDWADWNELGDEWVISPIKASLIIGVAPQTVQFWCKNKKIKAYQNGIGYWYIPIDVVAEQAEQRMG